MGDALAGIAGTLAFLWIIVTVLLQSQELSAQRDELVEQRNELRLSREEAAKSNQSLAFQRFENTFFSLLEAYNSIVSSIDLQSPVRGDGPARITTGRDCFGVFYRRLQTKYHQYMSNSDALGHAYFLFWRDNNHELGHY
ncbi:MAG: hypothetical protein AAF311_00265, partial [Pseudomonadota bacterium]